MPVSAPISGIPDDIFLSLPTPSVSPLRAALFMAEANFAQHFVVIFQPIAGEYDLMGKHPDAASTIRNVTKYEAAMAEMKEVITPEVELIETRIAGPARELQAVMKLIRKTITKRDHKVHRTLSILSRAWSSTCQMHS